MLAPADAVEPKRDRVFEQQFRVQFADVECGQDIALFHPVAGLEPAGFQHAGEGRDHEAAYFRLQQTRSLDPVVRGQRQQTCDRDCQGQTDQPLGLPVEPFLAVGLDRRALPEGIQSVGDGRDNRLDVGAQGLTTLDRI